MFSNLQINHEMPVYQQLCIYIKRLILKGELKNGDVLPSRRELASRLSINPNTVQKAYKALEDEQLVHTIGNIKTKIEVDEEAILRIRRELVEEMVMVFITQCKDSGVDFQEAIFLMTKNWKS